jgi:hypothetical protein
LSGQEYPGLVMLTMVTLDKLLPSRNNHDVSIEKGYSRLLRLTMSLEVGLNKPRKTRIEVQTLKKNHDVSQIVPVPNRTTDRNKVSVRSPIGQISLSHPLSKPIQTIEQYLELLWCRVLHQDNGEKYCTNYQEAWKVCGRSNDELFLT